MDPPNQMAEKILLWPLTKIHQEKKHIMCNSDLFALNEELMIQEMTKDGAITKHGQEVMERVFLPNNATGFHFI